MDNPEKLATHFTTAGHTRQRKINKQKNNPTQCALDNPLNKQAQIALIRHEPSYK
jgi:hypothetical protein